MDPTYLGLATVQLLAVLGTAALIALPCVAVFAVAGRPSPAAIGAAALSVLTAAFIGCVVGSLGGLSRVGVVGSLVPAALTLVGGFAVYIFGQKRPESIAVLLAVLAFTAGLFLHYDRSSRLRAKVDAIDACKAAYANPAALGSPVAWQNLNTVFATHCLSLFADQDDAPQPTPPQPAADR